MAERVRRYLIEEVVPQGEIEIAHELDGAAQRRTFAEGIKEGKDHTICCLFLNDYLFRTHTKKCEIPNRLSTGVRSRIARATRSNGDRRRNSQDCLPVVLESVCQMVR